MLCLNLSWVKTGSDVVLGVMYHLLWIRRREEIISRLWRMIGISPDEPSKIMELTTRWKEEGILQGMQICMQKACNEALTLRRLLRRRFGEIPVGVEQTIAQASLEQIDRWVDRAIDAPTLNAVFEMH